MKKPSLQKLSFLAVLALFSALLTMCTPAGNTANSDSEAALIAQLSESSTVQLYWNVDRLNYLTGGTCDTSTRPQDSDGKYTIPFAVNGSQVNLKVADSSLLNVIDFNDVVGLVLNADGDIQEVQTIAECTGDYAAYRSYVKAVQGNTVTCNTAVAGNGVDFTLTLTDTTGIYNVTKADASCGSVDTLTPGDQIIAIKDIAGNITHVYITQSFDMDHTSHCVCCGNTPMAQAQHTCDTTQNGWAVLTNTTIKNPTAVSGKYYLTSDVTIDSTLKLSGDLTICLNGYTLSCTNIRFNQACALTITDCSADGTGKLCSNSEDNTQMIFQATSGNQATINIWGGEISGTPDGSLGVVFFLGSGNNVLNIYGGTIQGSNALGTASSNAQGGAIRLSAGSVCNMYGGTITGGSVTRSNINSKEAMGGNIYMTGSATKFNLYGGTITSGAAIDDDTTDSLGAKGGNIYVAGGALNLYGGTITGGAATGGTGANIMVGGGTFKIMNVDTTTSFTASASATVNTSAIDSSVTLTSIGNDYTLTKAGDPTAAHANHCACCGNAPIAAAGHDCQSITYVPWDLDTSSGATEYLIHGSYYLTEDVILDARLKLDGDLNICLNGFELRYRDTRFATGTSIDRYTLNISDCSAAQTGKLTGTVKQMFFNSSTSAIAVTINVWGGTISDTATNTVIGHIFTLGAAGNGSNVLNIYGGTIVGGNALGSTSSGAQGGAMRISGTTVCNIYGGTITGGTATSNASQMAQGGNIYMTTAGTELNIYGGTITGGSAVVGTATGAKAAKGGNIYVGNGTLTLYGGAVTDGTAPTGANIMVNGGAVKIVNVHADTTITVVSGITPDVTDLNSTTTVTNDGNEYTVDKAS